MVDGSWFMVDGLLFMIYGLWFKVWQFSIHGLGFQFFVCGVWYLEYMALG
jgi:hypothetical protein